MKKTITVFFLLFTISAAAAFRPLAIPTVYHDDRDVSNDVVLTTKSSSDLPPNDDEIATTANEAVRLPESTTQTLFVNHRSHPIRLSRSNQINRHFYNADHLRIPLRFVRRHPCRNYFHINNQKLSLAEVALESDKTNPSGNDVVVTTVPSKWLEFKHEYGHHRHHHHDSELFQPKYEIDGDKLQMHHHHHHHHHQHKGVGFMRAIRKFLKHAFD